MVGSGAEYDRAVSLRDYFERRASEGSWGTLYEGPPNARTYNFLTRRAAVFDLLDDDGAYPRVLDVGCGTGDYAAVAARHDGVYHGVDFSPSMIAQARVRAAGDEPGARVAVACGEQLPFADDTFDLVLGLGFIAYFADPRSALCEIRRVLKPGGTLVLQVSKPDLCGWIDRVILRRLRDLVRRRRAAPAQLPDGWVNVKYRVRVFDHLLAEHGFERVDRAFNHFHVFPAPVRQRFPGPYIGLSETLTRWCPSTGRAFAVNYIGKYSLARG